MHTDLFEQNNRTDRHAHMPPSLSRIWTYRGELLGSKPTGTGPHMPCSQPVSLIHYSKKNNPCQDELCEKLQVKVNPL